LQHISRHERYNPEGSARFGRSFDLEREEVFTVGQESFGRESVADVVTLAEKVVTQTMANGISFDSNPSLTFGTIALTHQAQPRYVPVRAKYDTGSDVNLVPAELIVSNDLSSLLVEEEDTFIGLNNQEYHTCHTITLKWCAVNMHRMRTTKFHVTDDLPFDMVLGDSFIQENAVFDPQRVALPLRRKHRGSGTVLSLHGCDYTLLMFFNSRTKSGRGAKEGARTSRRRRAPTYKERRCP